MAPYREIRADYAQESIVVYQAYIDMVRRGFHPYTGLWNAWLRQTGWGHPERP